MSDHYRGWVISYDPPPIPDRSMDWSATGPNFDAELVDGQWEGNGEHVRAATRFELIDAIEAYLTAEAEV